jgi:PTS system, lactose/cellobiose family IIC component
MKFLEEKFVPLAAAIGAQKHLVAIRDGFTTIMPLSIAGAISVLLNNFHGVFGEKGLNMVSIQQGYADFLKNTHLGAVFSAVNRGALDMIAISALICIAYGVARSNGSKTPIATSVVSLGIYLGLAPGPVVTVRDAAGDLLETAVGTAGGVDSAQLGAQGLFVAMILALLVGEAFPRLSNLEKLKITLPDGVPPAVAAAFSSLIPAIITVIGFIAVGKYIEIFAEQNVWQIIQKFVGAPISDALDQMITLVIAFTMIGLLWTFGIHGAQVVGSVLQGPTAVLALENTTAFDAGETPIYNFPGIQSAFAFLGGSGATLGLIIAIFIFSKDQAARTVAKLSLAPGIFEINESVTFGIPIVLNPIYMIPFIFGPVILGIASWVMMDMGILDRVVVAAPWVTPPILIGFLSTGGQIFAAIWNAIAVVLLVIWWTPFVLINDKVNAKNAE